MNTKKRLVFATNNPHKLEEARQILSDRYEIISLSELGCHDDIPETADTLAGNAEIKARYVYDRYGCDCFADDTGLMVDALDGAPGVYSARYAGEHCSPADNVAKLLSEMKGISNRNAHFSTVISLIRDGDIHMFEGRVEGRIAESPSGNGGFGYDPVFIEGESGKAFAQMTPDEKNACSHRGRAMKKLADFISSLTLMIFLCLSLAVPTRAEEWRIHPSYDGQMENIVVTPDYVYFLGAAQQYRRGATNTGILYGMLFRYDKEDGNMTFLNSRNLLSGNVVTAIAYNSTAKYLAVAFDNGVVNLLYDNGDCKFIPALSIADPGLSKTINDFYIDEEKNLIYAATNFGYIIYDGKISEVKTSRVFNKEVVACVPFKGRIWLATAEGLFYGSPEAYAFSDFKKVNDLSNVFKLGKTSEDHMYFSYGATWNRLLGTVVNAETAPTFRNLVNSPMNGLMFSSGYAVASYDAKLCVMDAGGSLTDYSLPATYANSVAATGNGKDFWFSTGRKGISLMTAPSGNDGKWTVKTERFLPDAANPFMSSSMAYHPDYGMLVRNHGYETAFSSSMTDTYDLISGYKGMAWTPLSTAYRVENGLFPDNPWGVAIDPVNSDHVYCGSTRTGLFRLDLKNPESSMMFSKPSDIYGNETKRGYVAVVPQNPQGAWSQQCVFAAPAFDYHGNLWTSYVDPVANLSEGTSSRTNLFVWTPEARNATVFPSTFREWKKLAISDVTVGNNLMVLPLLSQNTRNVVLSYGNTKSTPLVVLDHGGTLDNTSDDRIVKLKNITDQDGESLKLYNVYTWYEDVSTGLVWVAYNEGLFTFNPAEALQNVNSVRRIKVPRNDGTNLADYLLNGVRVNSITSDASGRKWFSTQGAGLVCTSADGRTIYNSYTTENSDIPADVVYAVQYNPASNSMMISTEKGLCELFLSSSGSSSESDVRCFPNPVRPEYYGVVTIDGLSDDAMVKIVDASGALVKECGQALAGVASWDITNNFMKRVPGGVYFVMAASGPSADGYAKVGKILVVE